MDATLWKWSAILGIPAEMKVKATTTPLCGQRMKCKSPITNEVDVDTDGINPPAIFSLHLHANKVMRRRRV